MYLRVHNVGARLSRGNGEKVLGSVTGRSPVVGGAAMCNERSKRLVNVYILPEDLKKVDCWLVGSTLVDVD